MILGALQHAVYVAFPHGARDLRRRLATNILDEGGPAPHVGPLQVADAIARLLVPLPIEAVLEIQVVVDDPRGAHVGPPGEYLIRVELAVSRDEGPGLTVRDLRLREPQHVDRLPAGIVGDLARGVESDGPCGTLAAEEAPELRPGIDALKGVGEARVG